MFMKEAGILSQYLRLDVLIHKEVGIYFVYFLFIWKAVFDINS